MLNGTTSSRHSSWCAAPMTIVVAYAAMIAAPSTDDGDRASARCARRYEASNPLNFADAMVTLFIPIRGLRALLNAFQAGMDAGLLSGLMDGLLVYAWFSSRGDVTRRQRMLVGASLGAAAGVVAV